MLIADIVWMCDPGWEDVLADELARTFPVATHERLAAGWMATRNLAGHDLGTPAVAFAAQALTAPQAVQAASIAQWTELAGKWLIGTLAQHQGPWRLHVTSLAPWPGPVPAGRLRLIRAALLELLRKKQRRLLRSLIEIEAAWHADEALVQVGLVTPAAGYLSAALPDIRHAWRRVISQFPAGAVLVPGNRRPPSRAFAKLAEVELRLGRPIQPGETCVDLGASPGSWTWLALARGAQVTAADRSPLRPDLMRHASLTFVRGDAFRYRPPAPVDWLLCDVIAFPARSAELLAAWLSHAWCRRFCVTIKFRGRDEYASLEPIKRLLAASSAEFCLRRLTSNKNEVTAYGTTPAALA